MNKIKRYQRIIRLSISITLVIALVSLIVYGLGGYIFSNKECELPANTKVIDSMTETVTEKVVTVREYKRGEPTAEQIGSSNPLNGFACKTQKNGVPIGYKLVTNGKLWSFMEPDGHIFGGNDTTRERAIDMALWFCAHDVKKAYIETMEELPWKTVE